MHRVTSQAKQLSLFVYVQVLVEDSIVQSLVLSVQFRISEDAGQQQVVEEVSPLDQVTIYVWQGAPE